MTSILCISIKVYYKRWGYFKVTSLIITYGMTYLNHTIVNKLLNILDVIE